MKLQATNEDISIYLTGKEIGTVDGTLLITVSATGCYTSKESLLIRRLSYKKRVHFHLDESHERHSELAILHLPVAGSAGALIARVFPHWLLCHSMGADLIDSPIRNSRDCSAEHKCMSYSMVRYSNCA